MQGGGWGIGSLAFILFLVRVSLLQGTRIFNTQLVPCIEPGCN